MSTFPRCHTYVSVVYLPGGIYMIKYIF